MAGVTRKGSGRPSYYYRFLGKSRLQRQRSRSRSRTRPAANKATGPHVRRSVGFMEARSFSGLLIGCLYPVTLSTNTGFLLHLLHALPSHNTLQTKEALFRLECPGEGWSCLQGVEEESGLSL
ncbi:unnamed protein product [Boreogadus saida]